MPADPVIDIAIFARAPVPGQTKTRLIPQIGADGAARLQRQLILLALARTRALPGARVSLWSAGAADDPFMRRAASDAGVALRQQRGDDLGARMANAFADTLASAHPMLLIGTDCPAQRVDDLRDAVDALADADAVVQPAEDGGYVLIGMRQPHLALFDGIAWGTDTVCAATRARARDSGLRLAELPACWDLDRIEDLERAVACGLVQYPAEGLEP
jgi:uncharacterized protein